MVHVEAKHGDANMFRKMATHRALLACAVRIQDPPKIPSTASLVARSGGSGVVRRQRRRSGEAGAARKSQAQRAVEETPRGEAPGLCDAMSSFQAFSRGDQL